MNYDKKRANKYKHYSYGRKRRDVSPVEVVRCTKPKRHTEDVKSSNSWLALNHGVSIHCVFRYAQRVLGNHGYLERDTQAELAECIKGNIDFDIDEDTTGTFPYLDNFKIVVYEGLCITVKAK